MVFKKQFTKALPPGAEFLTVKGEPFARWQDRQGKTHRAPLTTKGDRIRLESARYYIRIRDGEGRLREFRAFTDLEASKARETELRRQSERGIIGLSDPMQDHKRRPVLEHVAAFGQFLANKGNTSGHVELSVQRVRDILEGCNVHVLPDISASRVSDYLAERRRAGLSVASSNHYTRAIRSFGRWLIRDRRLSENPLAYLPMLKADADLRRLRRALTEAEVDALIQTTRGSAEIRAGLPGPDRAMLYLFAVNTGLRVSELASLTPASLDFESDPATVRVLAAYSKHREEDVLPLRPDLVAALQAWIADELVEARLWPGKWFSRCRMFKADLAAAGVEYQDASGRYADFHSLRHTFITRLRAVHPEVARKLARHKHMDTTRGYMHFLPSDLSGALDMLPPLPSSDSRSERSVLAATGTDDRRSVKDSQERKRQLALQLAPFSDFACQRMATLGKTDRGEKANSPSHKPLGNKTLDSECHGMAYCGKHTRVSGGMADASDLKSDDTRCKQTTYDSACTPACTQNRETEPQLAEIMAAWPTLPEHIRAAILSLVRTNPPKGYNGAPKKGGATGK